MCASTRVCSRKGDGVKKLSGVSSGRVTFEGVYPWPTGPTVCFPHNRKEASTYWFGVGRYPGSHTRPELSH